MQRSSGLAPVGATGHPPQPVRAAPRDVRCHTSAHPTPTNQHLRNCAARLFPPRPHVQAVSGSEKPLSDRSQEERRPLAARLRITWRALGTGELRRRQLLLQGAATDGPMAPQAYPPEDESNRCHCGTELCGQISEALHSATAWTNTTIWCSQRLVPGCPAYGYQPGPPRAWSPASIDQSQSFP